MAPDQADSMEPDQTAQEQFQEQSDLGPYSLHYILPL